MSIGCWGYLNRGYDSEVDTPYRLPLTEVDCVSCGQCVSTCPVGAIVGQRTPQGAREWQTRRPSPPARTAPTAAVSVLHSYHDRVVKVASEVGKGLNGGNLCIKGRFGMGYADSPDRLTKPLVRNGKGELEETTWEAALALIKDKISAAKKAKGGQAVAAICGTHATNEAAYLLQKLMRAVVGSNNVDAIDHGEQAASEKALHAAFGLGGGHQLRATTWLRRTSILVVGANLTESHPVLALDVIKALRGGQDRDSHRPRARTELAGKAALHLAVKPGGDLAALRAMMRHLLDLVWPDKDFIAARTEGFAAFDKSLAGVDIAAEATACGVDADLLRAGGRGLRPGGSGDHHLRHRSAYAGAGGGVTVAALADLALLTGNIGRPGAGLVPATRWRQLPGSGRHGGAARSVAWWSRVRRECRPCPG